VKNQYFGDINDYRLYGLLRLLIGSGASRTAICWMLTPDDDGTDGGFTGYLSQPERWKEFDPDLFDALRKTVLHNGPRDVRRIEDSILLPSCRFQGGLVVDDRQGRARYFQRFWKMAEGCDLVFFDPDNGMEVRSTPIGRKGSSKYLYWHELEHAYSLGHSVLVFQYFPRVKREVFVERLAGELSVRTGAPAVYSFCMPRFACFLLPSEVHANALGRRACMVSDVWGDEIRVRQHNGD